MPLHRAAMPFLPMKIKATLNTARLAQSAERKALNLVVVGSSPTVGVAGWHARTLPVHTAFWHVLECIGTYVLERSGTFRNVLEQSGTFWNVLERSGTFRYAPETFGNVPERSGTLWNVPERSGTFRNVPSSS